MWFQITVHVNAYEVNQCVNKIKINTANVHETFISPETLQIAILKITAGCFKQPRYLLVIL